MLCQECERLVLLVLATDLSTIEQLEQSTTTLKEVLRSADGGCFICYTSTHHAMGTVRERRVIESVRKNNQDGPVVRTMLAGRTGESFKFLRVLHEALTDGRRECAYLANCDITLRPGHDEAKSILDGRESRRNTGDPAVIRLLQSWLLECLGEHNASKRPESAHRPSRLIDIILSGQDKFTVVETDTMAERPCYFTLSHRWSADTPTLKRDNECKYRSGVVWAQMPGAYHDAFKLVKALGYRYLWIDSLCIFQDDEQGKRAEILDMAEIYSNSLCNIVALHGRTDSLFTTRSLGAIDASLKINPARGEELPSEVIFQHRDLWTYEVTRGPLANRAWVLQEQLLAARTLYFGENQVYWECCAGRRSESHPTLAKWTDGSDLEQFSNWFEPSSNCDTTLWAWDAPLSVFFRRANAITGSGRNTLANNTTSISMPPEVADDIWYMLIIRYSTRQISFPYDRLSAVTGIAKAFARVTSYTWAAGLWKEQMPLNLLWHSELTETPAKEHGFPTWSWAAGAGVIPPFRKEFVGARRVAEIIDVECRTIEDDPFSLLSDAFLRIRALPLVLAFDSDNGNIGIRLSDSVMFPQTVGIDRDSDGFGIRPCNEYEDEQHEPIVLPLAECVELPDTTFMAVLIYTHARQQKNGMTALHIGGLLVERVPAAVANDSPALYHRFGMFHCRDWKVPSSQLPWARELFSLSKAVFSEAQQTHTLMDLDTARCLEKFTII